MTSRRSAPASRVLLGSQHDAAKRSLNGLDEDKEGILWLAFSLGGKDLNHLSLIQRPKIGFIYRAIIGIIGRWAETNGHCGSGRSSERKVGSSMRLSLGLGCEFVWAQEAVYGLSTRWLATI